MDVVSLVAVRDVVSQLVFIVRFECPHGSLLFMWYEKQLYCKLSNMRAIIAHCQAIASCNSTKTSKTMIYGYI